MKASKARKLVEKGSVRIGLTLCSVHEKVDVVQCYKCWNYDHRRTDCKEAEDRGNRYRRCTGAGHVEADCVENTLICLSCKVEGHKTGSGRCPQFRKALSRAKLLQRNKRDYYISVIL